MSKPNIPNQRKANIEHKKRIEAFVMRINLVYEALSREAARIASTTGHSGDTPFSFKDYPLTKDAVQQLMTSYLSQIGGIIMAGTSQEWTESNLLQDLLAEKVFKAYKRSNRKGEELGEYFRDNSEALKAFQQRKDNGMQLSDRVWNLSRQYKQELEESISVAIEPGISAVELAAKIKPYLNEPNKRFRRIRDKFGVLQLSDNALAYHPGRGVYRSSARNAQRLARTEINMAYRHAEQLRWSQMDFVVGYEVKLTQNGKHVPDICDELIGKYPKEFKFSGWHPHCLCYTIPILKTEDEFLSLDDTKPSINAVTDTPANFKQWVMDNKERIEAASERGKLPYFLRDNMDAWGKVVYSDFYGTINHKSNAQEIINTNNYQIKQETILDSDKYSYVDRYIGHSIVKKLYNNKTVRMLKTIEDSVSIEVLKLSAEKAFYKALGNKVIITINEDLISLDVAKNHLYEILSIVREYNLKQGTLEEIILGYKPEDDNEYGVTTTNEQTFNRTIKLTNSIPMRSNLDAIYNSRCDENRIQFSLATHECGHLLFNCNIAKNSEIFLAHEFESIYINYRKEIIQLANNGNLDELSNILIGDRGSYYNLNEFIAECFQEYRNSSNPSKYSIIIGNLIDSNFKNK